MIPIFVILALLVGGTWATSAEAVDRYVRQGATGAANGTNWTDAYTQITTCETAMVRSTQDTCWVADGTYNAVTFNTTNSGTNVLTIKKATVASHGTSTGWVDTYGDGQADIASPVVFGSNYWVFDGVTRDETNAPTSWFTGASYGFKVRNNSNAAQTQIKVGGVVGTADAAPTINNITIGYVWVEGRSGSYSGAERRYAIDTDVNGTNTVLHFHHGLSTDSNQWFFLRKSDTTLIEYWAGERLDGDEFNHGDAINMYFTADNVTIRWSVFRDGCSAGCTGMVPMADARGTSTPPRLIIYGNLFYDYGSGDGTIGFTGNQDNSGNCLNCFIYNNTFVNGGLGPNPAWGIEIEDAVGTLHRNNIWYRTTGYNIPNFDLGSSFTNSHNMCGSAATCTGTSSQTSVPTTIFTNFAGKDFTLASATTAGVTLTNATVAGWLQEYDKDMFGNTRGSDGTWDRGAFEFGTGGGGGGGDPPTAPTGVTLLLLN